MTPCAYVARLSWLWVLSCRPEFSENVAEKATYCDDTASRSRTLSSGHRVVEQKSHNNPNTNRALTAILSQNCKNTAESRRGHTVGTPWAHSRHALSDSHLLKSPRKIAILPNSAPLEPLCHHAATEKLPRSIFTILPVFWYDASALEARNAKAPASSCDLKTCSAVQSLRKDEERSSLREPKCGHERRQIQV